VTVDASTGLDLWTTFTARAELLGTAVVRADTEAAVAHLLGEARHVALTASAATRYPALAREFVPVGEASQEVAAVAPFAVAETGSLALNETRADRGACFLADRLWLLVPHDQLLETIDQAFARLAELIRAGARHPLLMSGPSRTADIERVLTVGVHGPRSVVAIIVNSTVR
jgi:L-lactate dehydrogenase complex protein LldG